MRRRTLSLAFSGETSNSVKNLSFRYRTFRPLLKKLSFEAKLKDCDVPIKFVVIFGKWNKDDDNKYHILITNNLRASAKMVITSYLLRWGIEHCFKELKDTFYFDHYQVRHINKIDRYWNLCLVAWTLTYWIKQNAYLTKILETKPKTFNEIKQAVNSLVALSSGDLTKALQFIVCHASKPL